MMEKLVSNLSMNNLVKKMLKKQINKQQVI